MSVLTRAIPSIPFKEYIIQTPLAVTSTTQCQLSQIGPSGLRALPLSAGINVGGHYKWHFGPSGVRALHLAAGINVGGHYK